MVERIASTSSLRPDFARSLANLESAVQKDGLPFKRFETIRSPVRQNELFMIGRDPDKVGFGRHVTSARAYQSAHQYGLAADFAIWINGRWTWEETGPEIWMPGIWDKFGKMIADCGLHQLHDKNGNLIERSHAQILPFNLNAMTSGPPDTAGWLAWLNKMNGAGVG